MSQPFVAEIKMWGGNFAPRSYAYCNGALLPISQNTALFSLVGTTYGGDGRTTLGLPNLQGRMPMHPGNGPGLSSRRLGEVTGTDNVTLQLAQIPNHNHGTLGNAGTANAPAPTDNYVGKGNQSYNNALGSPVQLAEQVAPAEGGGQSHNNDSPYLVVSFIIALQGTYPSRS